MAIETISFEEDARLMSEFLQLLEREQASLIANKVAEIEAIVADKSALLQKINAVAKNRYALLNKYHFEANENGMVAWVIEQADARLKKRWDSFQQLLFKAKETNRLNGLLISKHFNRNRQMLQGLQNAMKSNQVYGRNGQTTSSTSIRSGISA
jgi:flagella synthesis protein FlgN